MTAKGPAKTQQDKLRVTFHVQYRTRWGQSVVVYGQPAALGDWDVEKGKMMRCEEKKKENLILWHQTVALPQLTEYQYRYAVLDEGRQIEDEDPTTRILKIPAGLQAGQLVEVFDEWQKSDPAVAALSRAAYTKVILTSKATSPSGDAPRETPELGFVILRFVLRDWGLQDGEQLVVTGGLNQLGLWQPHAALPMVEVPPLHAPDPDRPQAPQYEAEVRLPLKSFPVTYKYALRSKDDFCPEAGDNRVVTLDASGPDEGVEEEGKRGDPDDAPAPEASGSLEEGQDVPGLVVRDDGSFRHDKHWRGAAVAVPVFSLRTENSVGAGDFADIKKLVDFCDVTGLRMIQLLPVNDTSVHQTWWDSYPYSSVSVFALHPLYLCLRATAHHLPPDIVKRIQDARLQLEAAPAVDYVETMRLKMDIAREIFEHTSHQQLQSDDFLEYMRRNEEWLKPYAVFCVLRDLFQTSQHWEWGKFSEFSQELIDHLTHPKHEHHRKLQFTYWLQWHLHKQLLDASQYAQKHRVALKGDLPIGVDKASVDTWMHKRLFRMQYSTGAPPDQFSSMGQNWGFPTYNWEEMKLDGYAWWCHRLRVMAQYFYAYRIDHILGFFRIWEIPEDCTRGLLGHFRPHLPESRGELEAQGIWDIDRLCDPYITPELLDKEFGDLAQQVLDDYTEPHYPGRYKLKAKYSSERQIDAIKAEPGSSPAMFAKMDAIRKGLINFRQNVILLRDAERPDHFSPRYNLAKTSSFAGLPPEWQKALLELHDSYFYKRHNELWERQAMRTLPVLQAATNMLVCGEDLGFVPECVAPVMERLSILGLKIQRFGDSEEKPFQDPATYSYMTVASPSCHDMSPIRAWWEEDSPSARETFYNVGLGEEQSAPEVCEPAIVRAILQQHVDSPAMWAVFALQDLMGMSPLYSKRPAMEEVINDPTNNRHYWQFRFHVTIEDLIADRPFIKDIQDLILKSGRATHQDLPPNATS